MSHLTIRRSSFKRDQGYYECRAMNVVSTEPAVRRFQVIVDRAQESKSTTKAPQPFRPITNSATTSLYNPARDKVSEDDRTKNTVSVSETTSVSDVSEKPKSLWFQAKPCPMSSYCLNGGTCSLYETVGEYVCQ